MNPEVEKASFALNVARQEMEVCMLAHKLAGARFAQALGRISEEDITPEKWNDKTLIQFIDKHKELAVQTCKLYRGLTSVIEQFLHQNEQLFRDM